MLVQVVPRMHVQVAQLTRALVAHAMHVPVVLLMHARVVGRMPALGAPLMRGPVVLRMHVQAVQLTRAQVEHAMHVRVVHAILVPEADGIAQPFADDPK